MKKNKRKDCKGCGEPIDHNRAKVARCRKCDNERRRARRKAKREARNDPNAHDYATKKVPEGYYLGGVSQYIKDGEVKAQWVKSTATKDQAQKLEEFLDAMGDAFGHLKGAIPPTEEPEPKQVSSELIDVVPIGDAHIGMMSWWQETGENFDLKYAKQMYMRTFPRLYNNGSGADTLALANLGDYYHSDGGRNTTTKGTPVDVDGRWGKVLRAGIEIQVFAIREALRHYKKVKVYTLAGNHDKEAAIALRVCLALAFEREPRVDIVESPRKYQFLRFGKCLIGFTHGDTCKSTMLPMIMATDRREDWGETSHHHFYTGHVHHDSVKDHGQVTVETVRVLGPTDAWHFESGYRSKRDIKIDTWHKTHGRIHRDILGVADIMRGSK